MMLVSANSPRLASQSELSYAQAIIGLFRPTSPQERATQEHILAFTAAHPDALLRSCVEGHLTGSALVVNSSGTETLLLAHKKLGRWLQPGGHADGEANLASVALREAIEETGISNLMIFPTPIDIDVHRIPASSDPAHDHLDVRFLVVAPQDVVAKGNHESDALAWVGLHELPNPKWGLDVGILRLAERAQRVLGQLR